MLPKHLIDVDRTSDGRIVPRWLGSNDEPWLEALSEELEAFGDLSVAEAEERVRMRVSPIARRLGASSRAPLAVWTVEKRRWKAHVASPVPPERVRMVVFDLAANLSRGDALAQASTELGMPPSAIEDALFADRAARRRLSPPTERLPGAELAARYNLALAQALVMRAAEMVVTVRGQLRSIVRFIKLRRLMVRFESTDDGSTRLFVSGPLALFHRTSKYRHALAELLTVLAKATGWHAHALVELEDETRRFEVADGAPIRCSDLSPSPTESNFERRLALDLERSSAYRLENENLFLQSANQLHAPDFTIAGPRGRIRVFVVGYWTPSYLERKRELLRALGEPILLCVDAQDGETVPEGRDILAFRGRIEAETLISAVERLLSPSAFPSRARTRDGA